MEASVGIRTPRIRPVCRWQDRRGIDSVGPVSPLVEPGPQQLDLPLRQATSLGRHGSRRVVVDHARDQLALAGPAGLDRWPRIAAGQGVRFAVEPQAGFPLLGPVALVAVVGQDRPDVAGEIDPILGARRAKRYGAGEEEPDASNGESRPNHGATSGRAGSPAARGVRSSAGGASSMTRLNQKNPSNSSQCGGRTWNEGGCVHDASELVVEIAKARRFVDLGPKLRDV